MSIAELLQCDCSSIVILHSLHLYFQIMNLKWVLCFFFEKINLYYKRKIRWIKLKLQFSYWVNFVLPNIYIFNIYPYKKNNH